MIDRGDLQSVLIGRVRLVIMASYARYLSHLAAEQSAPGADKYHNRPPVPAHGIGFAPAAQPVGITGVNRPSGRNVLPPTQKPTPDKGSTSLKRHPKQDSATTR
jgi:hypothetical protein